MTAPRAGTAPAVGASSAGGSSSAPHTPQLSPRERLQRGRPPKIKDVEVPGLGRFRLREIKQREIDEANEGLARREADESGKIVVHFDNRGHRLRLIAFTLVNDDGSGVYGPKALTEGLAELGELTKDVIDALWAGFDELNAWTKEARDELGKASGKTATASG